MSPVIRELRDRKINFKLITSGQNEILFDEFIDYLGPVKPDISFGYKSNKSSMIYFVLWAVRTFFAGLVSLRKEFTGINKENVYFVVHGDTISSLIGALMASFYGLKIVHVESGLRSYNFFEPFPEEISRFIISRLANINFCPNSWCVGNLKSAKGIKINTSQNTLIDIFMAAMKDIKKTHLSIKLPKKYFVLVVHRQEHVIFSREKTKEIFWHVLKNEDNLACVLIMHKLTSDFLNSFGVDTKLLVRRGVIPVPRLSYFRFMKVIAGAQYFITDGGSNQEEAFYLGKPCLLLRKRTERIEGLGGNVVLSKLNKQTISKFQKNYKKYQRHRVRSKISPAKIIVDYLRI
ncbi:MAG: UDP-N-acetylglucosamine 2-epimerase [Candidatus Woesebacteria bacterium GW2011_GWB1_43_14]|uniref:UDP-N-acetylglucosamine 2-epimerase n=1 Tax=Candidatus Woesebacteria bacterium GW2011_GWB1_43_14 TaxID=1618578 RepID=A0A0G1DHN7_9BACT|nr:MAG: UDP-N-acetylglucosamine 2-epimerase [Candidatus Woesebacteria bacterium GW2011_GWA1_39_11b]KKS78384.1 MAG: UDP-N-acetylglucosamine 2-epimerase [Candidatus Woesebacteria bacterium GW2011_GWC1_42_9]KKS97199.1 MAG: UDP-N-acetylglucosamine 2-epimerase [Candidatus Woesebacteria bacterium GW2011_GWB1_43_14]